MTLFGAIGLIFFLSFLRRPRVAPRRNRKVSGLEPGDDKAQPLGLVAPKPQPTADPRLSIIQAYSDWQLDLRRRRSQRAPQETPSEHAARLAADNERWSSQLMEVARTFSAALFGRKIMTHDDLETFLAHLRLLKSRLR